MTLAQFGTSLAWTNQDPGGALRFPDFPDRLTVLVVAGVLLSGLLVTLILLRRSADQRHRSEKSTAARE